MPVRVPAGRHRIRFAPLITGRPPPGAEPLDAAPTIVQLNWPSPEMRWSDNPPSGIPGAPVSDACRPANARRNVSPAAQLTA